MKPNEPLPTADLGHAPAPHRLASILSWARADAAADAAPLLDLADPEQASFGGFTLLELVGQGGMGLVYRARQESLDRDVALKLIGPAIEGTAGSRERFRREARLAAALNHPNILPVLEVGEHAGVDYIAMPFARGTTLADRCRQGAMPASEAVALMIPVCEAIDYAHRLGLLHLDLKPANILFDEHGAPLVADFGLARPMDPSGEVQAQEVSGTPGFMAPEQVLIKEFRLSRATDVYALGAILHRLVSGKSPHGTGDARELLQRVLAGRIEPIPADRLVPPDLQAICTKAMAWRPEERYSDASALLGDLRRFAAGLDISVRRPGLPERVLRWVRREPRLAWSVSLAGTLLLVALGTSIVAWWSAERGRRAAALATHAMIASLEDAQDRSDHLVPLRADEPVPVVHCGQAQTCPRSAVNHILRVENDLGDDAAGLLVEIMGESIPSDAPWGRSARNTVDAYRRLKANFPDRRHLAFLQELDDPLARLAAGMIRVHQGEFSADTPDAVILHYLRDDASIGSTPDAVQVREEVLRRLSTPDALRVVATFCADGSPACLEIHRALVQREPDNAVNLLLSLPIDVRALADPRESGASPEFPDALDSLVLRAAGLPRFETGSARNLRIYRTIGDQWVDSGDPGPDADAAIFAHHLGNMLDVDGYLMQRVSLFCRWSTIYRDRPDIEKACAAILDLAAAIPDAAQSLRIAAWSVCDRLHLEPDPVRRGPLLARFRELAWYDHVDQNQRWTGDEEFRLNGILAHGGLPFIRQLARHASPAARVPDHFLAMEPLPWRDASRRLITARSGQVELRNGFASACLQF